MGKWPRNDWGAMDTRAGIHPRKKLEDWSAKDEGKVFHAIRDVMADMTEQGGYEGDVSGRDCLLLSFVPAIGGRKVRDTPSLALKPAGNPFPTLHLQEKGPRATMFLV